MIRPPVVKSTGRRRDFFILNAHRPFGRLPGLALTPVVIGNTLFGPSQKTKAGRENPSNLQASERLSWAFFYACTLSMAGGTWAGFGLAGVLKSRFLTPCIVRRPSAVRSGRDGSIQSSGASMKSPNHGRVSPKTCPLPLDQADKIDRTIHRLAEHLDSLSGDIACLLYDTTGDRRLRTVQAQLKAALKHLEAAKTPARALWNDALAATHQGGRDHG
jgi:hypothetical protein